MIKISVARCLQMTGAQRGKTAKKATAMVDQRLRVTNPLFAFRGIDHLVI
jgi:hypothetical protein